MCWVEATGCRAPAHAGKEGATNRGQVFEPDQVLSARVERASFCLGDSAPGPRARALGDVRVSIPSRMHSQCTGFASSLTSQSSRLESNQHPSCSQGTCPATRLLLGGWVAPVSIRPLCGFNAGQSPDLLTTQARRFDARLPIREYPMSVTIRPGGLERPATSPEVEWGVEQATSLVRPASGGAHAADRTRPDGLQDRCSTLELRGRLLRR